jgi:PAS domain-containing protein
LVVDQAGLIQFADPSALAALGYEDVSDLLGEPGHQTIHYKRPDGTAFPVEECPMLLRRTPAQTVHAGERPRGTLVLNADPLIVRLAELGLAMAEPMLRTCPPTRSPPPGTRTARFDDVGCRRAAHRGERRSRPRELDSQSLPSTESGGSSK